MTKSNSFSRGSERLTPVQPSDMSSPKKPEKETEDCIGISCFTVAIAFRGERSEVIGTMDTLTSDWLDQVVWEATLQSTSAKLGELEHRSNTALIHRATGYSANQLLEPMEQTIAIRASILTCCRAAIGGVSIGFQSLSTLVSSLLVRQKLCGYLSNLRSMTNDQHEQRELIELERHVASGLY